MASGLVHADAAFSKDVHPLYSFNQSPLIQIYGLPALGDARVLTRNESDFALRLQISNTFTGALTAGEYLHLDGELHRASLSWRQGLATGSEWGFELPYLWLTGGFLDKHIEDFHRAFGLPQGGRENVPRNQVNYRYTRQGVNLIDVTQPANGIGDIRLQGARQLTDTTNAGVVTSLRASLKLPTGKESELLGSGSTDFALWLSMATTRPLDSWNFYGGGGLMYMTEGNVLPGQQRNHVAFGTVGTSWMLLPHVTVIGQIDAQTPFYDYTQFRQLNSYPVQGLAGLRWEMAPRKFLEFSATEDLIVDTSSDIVFMLSLSSPF